jgi:SNF2 family DNA or RNA helicase
MHLALASLATALTRPGAARDTWLALAVLQKRAFSSARSLEQSIGRSLAARPAPTGGMWQPMLPLDDSAGELDSRDLPPAWNVETFAEDAETRRRLEAVADIARAAAVNESKPALLARLLSRLQKLGEPAIVFTEYRDTLAHIHSVLRLDAAMLHGGLAPPERRAELESFTSGRRSLLLATDAAGEGLNLHHTCRVVINLELPWSPARIEQRIGRVDRIGQRRRVHAFHLIARDTGEMRLLDHLRVKIERVRQDIASDDPLGNIASSEDESGDDEVMSWIIASDSR